MRGAEHARPAHLDGHDFNVGGVHFTVGVVMMLLLYVAVAFILAKTAWGRHVYAVGDDKEAARLAGIRVNRVLMSVYLAAGAILARRRAGSRSAAPTPPAPTPASTSTSTPSPPSSSAERASSAAAAPSGAPCSAP